MNETGKNKYSKEFKVPEEFPEILRYLLHLFAKRFCLLCDYSVRNLTREILRNQPVDIEKFGKRDQYALWLIVVNYLFFFCLAYEYFANELQARAANSED